MATMSESLGKTIELIFDIVVYGTEKTYQKIKTSAPAYLKSLAKAVIIWFLVILASILLKAYTGWILFAYIGVALCLVLGLTISLLASPLGIIIGMLQGKTLNPAEAGSGYVKGCLSIIFVTLLIFLYIIKIPIENNPSVVPLLLICALILVIGIHLWGSWIPPKLYTLAAMATVFYTTITLLGIKPLDYVFESRQSTYLGRTYTTRDTIEVTHKPGEFSELVTLSGQYKPIFFGSAEFLAEGSDTPIVIKSHKDRFSLPFNTFRVRTLFNRILFIPQNK